MSPPTNQHPVFYRPDALPVSQPTVSKHWMEIMSTFLLRGIYYSMQNKTPGHMFSSWRQWEFCKVGSTVMIGAFQK